MRWIGDKKDWRLHPMVAQMGQRRAVDAGFKCCRIIGEGRGERAQCIQITWNWERGITVKRPCSIELRQGSKEQRLPVRDGAASGDFGSVGKCPCQEPHRPDFSHRTVATAGIEVWSRGRRNSRYPLPPPWAPLSIGVLLR